MRKTRLMQILLTATFFISTTVQAYKLSSFELCLKQTNKPTSQCLKQHLKQVTLDNCYNSVTSIRSQNAKEKVKNYCFYQISEFSNLKSCVTKAAAFYEAESRDQGLFECYRQFSQTISKSNCTQIANHMIFSDKKNHMKNICDML